MSTSDYTRQRICIVIPSLQVDSALRRATSLLDSMFELIFVGFGVEMPLRFSNQPVLPNLPHFIAADANLVAGPSGPSVGSD